MNTPKWIIAHFSPTGGTKRVADAIAAGFSVPVAQMDLTKADSTVTLGENDGLMAVLPVFAGRVPQIALERLSALKGSGQKAVAVVVYGNREFDDALLETKKIRVKAGLNTSDNDLQKRVSIKADDKLEIKLSALLRPSYNMNFDLGNGQEGDNQEGGSK